jgi:hypothetical protein
MRGPSYNRQWLFSWKPVTESEVRLKIVCVSDSKKYGIVRSQQLHTLQQRKSLTSYPTDLK